MIGFFVALEHCLKGQLQNDVESYMDPSGCYILAMETAKDKHVETKGEHFHYVGDMSLKQYDSFRKTILVAKYKRQGVARNGIGRQYGRIGKIRDETKLMTYTVKDENIIFKNIDLKTIKEYIRESYKKEDRQMPIEQLMLSLQNASSTFTSLTGNEYHYEFYKIELAIIQFYMLNSNHKKVLSKAQVRNLTTRYLMYYTNSPNIQLIHQYIMNFH